MSLKRREFLEMMGSAATMTLLGDLGPCPDGMGCATCYTKPNPKEVQLRLARSISSRRPDHLTVIMKQEVWSVHCAFLFQESRSASCIVQPVNS